MRNIITSWIRRRKPASNSEDPFLVQKFIFNDAKQLIIFDVGAYVGNITAAYRGIFPQATIYCFEPFPDSFRKLSRLADGKFVKCYQMAICEVNGRAKLQVDSDPSCNSLHLRPKTGARYYPDKAQNIGQIEVETQTLDTFCNSEDISEIDILKLDVEGAEIKVLQGASEKLGKKQIKLIYTEIMFVPHYECGCLFYEVASLLDKYGYTLFNFYHLKRARNGQLRRGDAIFVSPEIRTRLDANQLQGN
jgi:FkbM family methyltransferase